MTLDPSQTKLIAEHKHETPLLSCAFDPTGRFLFAGGRDNGILVVGVASSKKALLKGHEGWVGWMAPASGDQVLTADTTGRVIAWDCGGDEPKQSWAIDAHPCAINGLSVSADGKSFATGDRNGTIRTWQSSDGKKLTELPRLEDPVYGVAWHPDGRRLVTADRRPQKPRIKVWDIVLGKEVLVIEVAELSGYRRVEDIEWGGIRGLTVSPDGRQIVACGRNGYDGPATAYVYDMTTGKLQRRLASPLKGGFYYAVRFHPDGFLIAAGGDVGKGEFRTWGAKQDTSLADVATPGPCTALDIHPNGKRLAVTQTVGKRSYPDAGTLSVYEWVV